MEGQAWSRRQAMLSRRQVLRTDMESWRQHWDELGQHVRPWTARVTKAVAGEKRHESIINDTATVALRTLAAGMQGGMTSPARPWFGLTVDDPDLADDAEVKTYLVTIRDEVLKTLSASGTYGVLHGAYSDAGLYGTAAMHIDEDPKSTVRAYKLAVGRYALLTDGRGRITGCFRDVTMTVDQIVSRWGLDAVLADTARAWRNGQKDLKRELVHVVEPNPDFKAGALDTAGKAYLSTWWELTGANDTEGPLEEGGYQECPIIGFRWEVTDSDVYGESPGMAALGDIKALQHHEKRKAQLIDKITDPPMKGDATLATREHSTLPGSLTLLPGMAGVYEPAVVVHPQAIGVVAAEIRAIEMRIRDTFFASLFLAMAQADSQMTAREVAAREQEKLIQLGPVVERVQVESLAPLIERVVAILQRAGKLPPLPEAFRRAAQERGSPQSVGIEYLSILAQAQKLVAANGIERLVANVGSMVGLKPDVADTVDLDEVVVELADVFGVVPSLVRPAEEVAKIRAERMRQAQAQAQAAQAAQDAETVQKLGNTPLGDRNALQVMAQNFGAR